jgi:hypothetical protein
VMTIIHKEVFSSLFNVALVFYASPSNGHPDFQEAGVSATEAKSLNSEPSNSRGDGEHER